MIYDIHEDALKSTGQFERMHQYDARAFVSIMIPAPARILGTLRPGRSCSTIGVTAGGHIIISGCPTRTLLSPAKVKQDTISVLGYLPMSKHFALYRGLDVYL